MTRSLKIIISVAAACVVVALSVAYYYIDPATYALAPKCLFKTLTGLDCPGCGSQRMLHALLHGDLAGAWEANAFLLMLSPLLLLMIYSASVRRRHPRLYEYLNSVGMITGILILLIGWSIFRNIF